jgi:hypothetical protein
LQVSSACLPAAEEPPRPYRRGAREKRLSARRTARRSSRSRGSGRRCQSACAAVSAALHSFASRAGEARVGSASARRGTEQPGFGDREFSIGERARSVHLG